MEDTLSRIQRRNNTKLDLHDTFNKLNAFIDKLNEKIINRIQLVQQTYIEDYKAQVKEMSEELKAIRGVLDEELLRQRSNQRLFYLEEERDFFRGQTTKLNEEVTALTKANAKLKAALEDANAEAANFKQLVYSLQKKIVRVHNDAYEIEKLNASPTKMPSIAPEKEGASISPTKTTLTRYSPLVAQPEARPLYRSVEMRKSLSKQAFSSELKRRDEILQQCIKDIKKKIFYRTLSEKETKKLHFNQLNEVPFEKFTRTDKEDLIRSILNRDQLLGQFYNFMLGKKEEKLPTRKSFNGKSVFSDKIFKIKLCGFDNLS